MISWAAESHSPVADLVVKDLVVGLSGDHLVIADDGERLLLGVGHVARRFELDGLVVGILFRAIGLRREVHALVALPGSDQARQGAVVHAICHLSTPRLYSSPSRQLAGVG